MWVLCFDAFIMWHRHLLSGCVLVIQPDQSSRTEPGTFGPSTQAYRVNEIAFLPWYILFAEVNLVWVKNFILFTNGALGRDICYTPEICKVIFSILLSTHLNLPYHLLFTLLSAHSPKTHWVMMFITQQWKYCYLWLQSGCHQIWMLTFGEALSADCLCKWKCSFIISSILGRNNQPRGCFSL